MASIRSETKLRLNLENKKFRISKQQHYLVI